jgi:hypothetical protein
VANLFTSQTPSSTDNSDGTPGITFAVTVTFAVDGQVTGVRFYSTTTVSGTYTGALWAVNSSDPGTGTALATKTMGAAPSAGAWNTITFDTPVSVTAGVAYRAGVFSGAGRYVATLSFFGSALTNGDITAPAHNGSAGGFTVSQGTFRIDASLGYPNSPGSGQTNYFADVEFTAGGTQISVSDAGSAAESLAVAVAAALAESGSGADSPTSAAAAPLGDSASSAEALAPVAALALGDAGSADQALAVVAAVGLTESGAAADAGDADDGTNVPKSFGDTGAASERLRTTTVRPNTGITTRPFTGITFRP